MKKKLLEGFLWIMISYLFLRLLSFISGLPFAAGTELPYLIGFAITVIFLLFVLGFNLKWALIFLILLAVHEFGHILAGRLVGAETRGFAFYGLFGGANITQSVERWKDFVVAFAGPFLGILGALALLRVERLKRKPAWLPSRIDIVVWYAIVINLFNLLPIYPLDGGRMFVAVGASISPAFFGSLRIISFIVLGITALFLLRQWGWLSFIWFVFISIVFFNAWGTVSAGDIVGIAMGPLGIILALLAWIGLAGIATMLAKKLAPKRITKEDLKKMKEQIEKMKEYLEKISDRTETEEKILNTLNKRLNRINKALNKIGKKQKNNSLHKSGQS